MFFRSFSTSQIIRLLAACLLLLVALSANADIYVNGYFKKDGNYVEGYYKTTPQDANWGGIQPMAIAIPKQEVMAKEPEITPLMPITMAVVRLSTQVLKEANITSTIVAKRYMFPRDKNE